MAEVVAETNQALEYKPKRAGAVPIAGLIQIVYFNQTDSNGVAYTAHDRGVVARLQVCNDRRFACRSRNVAAVLNIADLTAGDNPAEYCRLPVIISSNQCSASIVQF